MKKIIFYCLRKKRAAFSCLLLSLIGLSNCRKSELDTVETLHKGVNHSEVIQKLKSAGFETSEGLRTFRDGYIVENDIYLTLDEINRLSDQKVIAKSKTPTIKHYVTNNLVSVSTARIIRVFMDPDFGSYMQNAFDAALARYNNLNLNLIFERTSNSNNADIIISDFYEVSGTLGFSGGFPSSGNPASSIELNTYYYNTSNQRIDATTTITHEIGHAIGFRHTDYMNRSISCGSGGTEGLANVGANHIPNTPTTPILSDQSWMLACSNNVDRPFRSADITALTSVYPFAYADGTKRYEQNGAHVYVIFGGAKFAVPTEQVLNDLYGGWSGVQQVPDGTLSNLPLIPRDGTKLYEQNGAHVYIIYSGAKFAVPTEQVLNDLYGGWSNVNVVPDGTLSAIPDGIPRTGMLVREQSIGPVYYIENGLKRWVTTETVLLNRFASWDFVKIVPNYQLNNLSAGADIN